VVHARKTSRQHNITESCVVKRGCFPSGEAFWGDDIWTKITKWGRSGQMMPERPIEGPRTWKEFFPQHPLGSSFPCLPCSLMPVSYVRDKTDLFNALEVHYSVLGTVPSTWVYTDSPNGKGPTQGPTWFYLLSYNSSFFKGLLRIKFYLFSGHREGVSETPSPRQVKD
jgi:hypothetical protein